MGQNQVVRLFASLPARQLKAVCLMLSIVRMCLKGWINRGAGGAQPLKM